MTRNARRREQTQRLLAVLAAVLTATALVSCTSSQRPEPQSPAAAVRTPACDAGDPLVQELDNGSAWSLCWRIDPKLGLVLDDITFAPVDGEPVLVAESLALAQLEVPYDTGQRTTYDLTEAGFGGTKLQTLTETECLGDRIATDVPDIGDGTFGQVQHREVLCAEVDDAGLGYRSGDQGLVEERRSEWRLSTISKVGWYEYISLYVFGSDGTIRPRLGATGDISPLDFTDHDHGSAVGEGDDAHAASHSHNAVWRVHWALGDPGRLAVEQYDAAVSEAPADASDVSPVMTGSLTPIAGPATAQWEDRRWWRVVAPGVENADGHPIGYQIDLEHSDSFLFTEDHHRAEGADGYDVAFTNADDCQLFAAKNPGGCGSGVPDYIAGSAGEPLTDVVSWVAVGFHHVVRDEDQSPMDVHWQGFTLMPRDLTAQRVGVPEAREDVNGVPDDTWTQEYEWMTEDDH